MNRISVIDCIKRHLLAACKEPGGLRPLGELIPPIAAELRVGVKGTITKSVIIPVPLVAAFIDGAVTPQEEFTVCQAIQFDNSVLAELVAGVLALDEVSSIVNPPPPLSDDLTARLFKLSLDAFKCEALESVGSEPITGIGRVVASDEISEELSPVHANQNERGIQSRSSTAWLQSTIAILVVAACLLLVVWWSVNQSILRQRNDQVVHAPVEHEVHQPFEPKTHGESATSTVTDDGIAKLAPQGSSDVPAMEVVEQSTPKVQPQAPPNIPNVIANAPIPSEAVPVEFKGAPIENIRWKKISGLLAERVLRPDYGDDSGWKGVPTGNAGEPGVTTDSKQLLTLPMSRAEAEVSNGGSIVMAADTSLTWTSGSGAISAKVILSHGQVAFVDMPQDTVIAFSDANRALATAKWMGSKATLLMAVTDAGLQAQVTGGEIVINQQSVRSSIVSIESQAVNEIKDRSTRLPGWVSRSVESIPISKAILGQLAGADNLAETLDRIVEANSSAGDTDKGRLLLSTWRVSLGDANLLRGIEARPAIVRLQALGRLMTLPEWDVRYKLSWAKFSSTVNNEADVSFLRQAFELVRRRGKLNAVQTTHLVRLLESPQLAVRSLSDFILRSNFGGGPQFDPNLNPPTNTRGVGLWKRYISAILKNG